MFGSPFAAANGVDASSGVPAGMPTFREMGRSGVREPLEQALELDRLLSSVVSNLGLLHQHVAHLSASALPATAAESTVATSAGSPLLSEIETILGLARCARERAQDRPVFAGLSESGAS